MEALIYVRDNTSADPERDRRGCYKVGMVVVVFDDGHVWGREESKQVWVAEGRAAADWPGQGRWIIIKIPGVPASRALALLDRQMVDDVGTPVLDAGSGKPLPTRRRDWQLTFGAVPQVIRDAAAQDGEVTVTAPQIRNFLKRIRDGAQFTGLD